jgi:hypothetical protein
MSDAQIAKVLKRAKAPDYKRVMRGIYKPSKISKQIKKEAYRSDRNKISNPFDLSAISEAKAEFRNKPFKPEAYEEQRAQQAPPSIMPPPTPGAVPPPSPPPTQSLFDRGIDGLRDIELDKLLGS